MILLNLSFHIIIIYFCFKKKDIMPKGFATISFPEQVKENFAALRIAFESCYGKEMSNGDIFNQLVSALEEGDAAVYEKYCELIEKRNTKK